MSRYRNEGEFFEADLAARSELRTQMEKARLYRLERRSRRMIAQHPQLLERGGFQIESSDIDPERVGLESCSDQMSPEELVELFSKEKPMTIDWDTRLACYVP
jgi:hypothetical protein